MSLQTNTESPGKFAIFRASEAPALSEVDTMEYAGMSRELVAALGKLVQAGIQEGETVKVLFSAPGFSLTYAWFKSGFPLARHSHNADCLYYIIAGSLMLGSQTLGAGDGFFVPCDAAYTYVPGPQGVEILEFRHAQHFNIKFMAANPAFWTRAVNAVQREREVWKSQPRPQDLAAASPAS